MSLKFAKSIELIELSLLMSAANLPDADGKSDSKPRRYFLKYPKYILNRLCDRKLTFGKHLDFLFLQNQMCHISLRILFVRSPALQEKSNSFI